MNKVDKIIAGELTEVKFKGSERNLFVVTPQEEKYIGSATGGACYKVVKTIKDSKDNDILLFAVSSINECKFSVNEIKTQ